MLTDLIMQAEYEVARFLASSPTAEEIARYHLSAPLAARYYDLVDAEREGKLDPAELLELEAFMGIEHFMRLIKAEAQKRLNQQAS
ncbi:MAG TPA: hypothetical protein VKQ36_06175 [Ktedonobacterales bacterium]|nr:hypothetical protein [Ktedonobacterales bacterium]